MPKFTAIGTVLVAGATFTITAETLAEAMRKAKVGLYDGYELDTGEGVECKVDIHTVRSDD